MLNQEFQNQTAHAAHMAAGACVRQPYAAFVAVPTAMSYLKFHRKPREAGKRDRKTTVPSTQAINGDIGEPRSPKRDDWETPDHVFEALNQEFNFDLDPCCYTHTAKCADHFTKEDDGLKQSWAGRRVWMNPPYGEENMPLWLEKARQSAHKEGALVVCLVPANTGTEWFLDALEVADECRFIKGRLSFKGAASSADFASAIFVFRPREVSEISPEPHREGAEKLDRLSALLWELFPEGPGRRKQRRARKKQPNALPELSHEFLDHRQAIAHAFRLAFQAGEAQGSRDLDLETIALLVTEGQPLGDILRSSSAQNCPQTHEWLAMQLNAN